jgi:HEAT repeat protein
MGWVGLPNVMLLSFGIMILGTGMLYYLSVNYAHAFPDSPKRQAQDVESYQSKQRLKGAIWEYVVLLFSFFVLAQMLLFSIEFQFFQQLEIALEVSTIASFLGIFSGLLGLIELFTQWFTSSRLIEREGVFAVALVLPSVIVTVGVLTLALSLPIFGGASALFFGLVILKFFDEWLRYTLVATTRPVLFQPIPDRTRSTVQSLVGGIAEPLAMGGTGVIILVTIAVANRLGLSDPILQSQIFLAGTVAAGVIWFGLMALLRTRYLDLLVQGAERGMNTYSDADRRGMRKNLVEGLEKNRSEADKHSYIDILSQIAPRDLGEVLTPHLASFSSSLQQHSLQVMLQHPDPKYHQVVRTLFTQTQDRPEVQALALRYMWLAQETYNINELRPYLSPDVDAVVRGTAASLMLRRGNINDRAEATATLRKMLVNERERERVMGCQALGDADYMESLSIYIDDLLQDPSLRVRRAILEAIAATQYKKYYPSLLKALQYKSTRTAASDALTRLGDEALPMLETLATNEYKPEVLRNQAWQVIGAIGTSRALEVLIQNLMSSWGPTRRQILRILLKLYQETGVKRSNLIDNALDQLLGRSGFEELLDTELAFVGQILAAKLDLGSTATTVEERLLQSALEGLEADAIERLFMLLRFISPANAVQAAQTSLSGSVSSWAKGLEILDNCLDISSKRTILILLDRQPDAEKLKRLSLSTPLITYTPLSPRDRLRQLLDLRNFLSDWALACCFHLAKAKHWNLTATHTLALLQHPTGFVREAVLAYVAEASPRALRDILPRMQQDPNELVARQVNHLMRTYNLEPDL